MEIRYCDNCGFKIAPDAFSAGTAVHSDDGRIYCAKCAPLFEQTTSALMRVSAIQAAIDSRSAVEKSPAVTKFYFCETCGKRITDKQILEGLGRDKKLKGVYCKDCAVGVMTMEFAVIREVPGTTKTAPPPQSSKPPTIPSGGRKGSAFGLAPVAPAFGGRKGTAAANAPEELSERIPSAHGRKSVGIGERRARRSAAIIGGVATAFVTVLAIILTSYSSRPPIPAKNRANDPIAPALQAEIPNAPKDASNSHPLLSESKVDTSVEPQPKTDPEIQAKADYHQMVKFEGLAEGDTAGRVAAVEEFLRVHGDSAFTEPARELLSTLKKSVSAKPVPIAQDTPRVQDTAKRLDPRNGSNAASKDADVNAALQEKQDSDLTEIQALRQTAVEALRQRAGTTVTLTIRGAKMSGLVKADPNHRDQLTLTFRDGPEMTIRSDQLEAHDVDAYAPFETGSAKAEDLRRRGLLFQAAGATARAEDYLIKARDAGLGDAIGPDLERTAALKLGEKEAAASEVWNKAEAMFASRNWKAAKQAYEMFQHDYVGSAALANNVVTLKERLEAIEWAVGPPREVSLDLGGGVQLGLELIPAGEFEMGSKDGDKNEQPVHKVKITRSFYMGKYVVTQAQYEKVVGNNPSHFNGANLPVEMVNLNDAEDFCKKASKLTGRSIRLPTEAEWEYACRAGTKTKYNTGDNDAALQQAGWFNGNSGGGTHPVGQKKPNAWGLYDMHGNVWQWCKDWYTVDCYEKSETENPQGPAQGAFCILRGGSWNFGPMECRSAHRGTYRPGNHLSHVGFRVILAPP